jgi:hypothetical protein
MPTELELLDSEAHRSLRIARERETAPHFVQVVVSEFAAAATCCPILLTKTPDTGAFYAGALYGFKPGENLLHGADGGPPPYYPLDLERQGFFISAESIAIDPDHARFDAPDGEALFDESGAPSQRLRRIQQVLAKLKTGVEETDKFIRALLAHRLIDPVDVTLRFDDGETLALQGLYTVSLDSLHELDDAAVLELFRHGYLQLAYCMAESLKQIPALAHRRNRRLAAALV